MAAHVTLENVEGGTRMTCVSVFVDEAQMKILIDMGMAEGMTQAVSQIDDLLLPTSA
jgi:hypothetical protein